MKLTNLFPNYQGRDVEISGLSINTQTLKKGDLFLCIKGATVDRHDYIDQAIRNGAAALLTAKDVDVDIPYVKVENPNLEMEDIYRRFYNNPQNKLKIIGITGTDGKTSTSMITQKLIGSDKCGYIGTNGYSCAAFKRDTDNTTPGIDSLYRIFSEFVDSGCEYVAMETSSEAFFYGRLKNISFVRGVITNVDREHLNTHKTLENYISCKKQLFNQCQMGILNANDKYYNEFKTVNDNNISYGYQCSNDLYIRKYDILADKTLIDFVYQNKEYHITSPLLGKFNVENLMAALACCLSLGFEIYHLLNNLPALFVDGRMNSVNTDDDYYVIVDYAHTPNGLRRLFEFTNTLNINRTIVVIGQAGERDPYKRKDVGKIVADNAQLAIFTYEDPRNEDVDSIIEMMTTDIKDYDNYLIIKDRHEAIEKAIMSAQKNDMVLILGKGNEDYQLIKGECIDFNDIDEAKKAIAKKKKV